MHYTTLGRTGLKVSVAGLGCGGASRLGLARGKSRTEAADLVHAALDLGVNLIDTARIYGTEEVIGGALKSVARDSVVLCTKHLVKEGSRLYSAEDVVAGLNESLRCLGTDYVDVFYIHGLSLDRYDHAINTVLPALKREQEKGKFRFLAASEAPPQEPRHEGTVKALEDDLFDVFMLAFSMVNQTARELVFPKTLKQRVGTTLMFVVRAIFADKALLGATVRELVEKGELPRELAAKDDALDFLLHAGGAKSHTDAAYRYARHEPGVDVVLFGTGSIEHMRENVASILAPPLPEPDRAKLKELFGKLVGVGLHNHSNPAQR
jgi:aryl-alcohol dehydrogenase-like predicted oxidoreductase